MGLDTQVFCMPSIFLEFGYTVSKLQSLFGKRNQERKSQIARRQKKIYYKYFSWALDFGFDQDIKDYSLLKAMKPKGRECY